MRGRQSQAKPVIDAEWRCRAHPVEGALSQSALRCLALSLVVYLALSLAHWSSPSPGPLHGRWPSVTMEVKVTQATVIPM